MACGLFYMDCLGHCTTGIPEDRLGTIREKASTWSSFLERGGTARLNFQDGQGSLGLKGASLGSQRNVIQA